MAPQLIITADDFGATPLIDRGIIKAIENGLITSVACFANGDHASFERIKKLDRDYGNKIDIGCHFNISSGPPLTDLSSRLVRKKKGKKLFKRILKFNLTANHLKEIKKELEQQIERFNEAGIAIKHFSDHYGVIGMFDKELCQTMLEVVKAYNAKNTVNAPLRVPVLWSVVATNPDLKKSKMKSLARLGNLVRKSILDVDDERFFQIFPHHLMESLQQYIDSGINFPDYLIDQFYQASISDTVSFIKALHSYGEGNEKSDLASSLSTDAVFEMMVHISDKPKESENHELKKMKQYWKMSNTSFKEHKPFELRRLQEIFVPVVKNEGLFEITKYSAL